MIMHGQTTLLIPKDMLDALDSFGERTGLDRDEVMVFLIRALIEGGQIAAETIPTDMLDALASFSESNGRDRYEVIRFLILALFEGGQVSAEACMARKVFDSPTRPVTNAELLALAPNVKLVTPLEKAT